MPAVLAFLGSAFAKIFTDKVLSWIAIKALLVLLLTVVFPIVLNNFLYDIIEIIMNFAAGQAGSAGTMSGAMSFTGFAAWLVESFRLAEALSVLVGSLLLRLALSMIPFVRMV
jgi:hypothetical protein